MLRDTTDTDYTSANEGKQPSTGGASTDVPLSEGNKGGYGTVTVDRGSTK